jgi:methionyl aminopeptidase
MVVIRSEWEIGLLRTANQIVAEVLATLAEYIEPGITTKELDTSAENMIRERGATPSFKGYNGYPAAICVSVEDEVVHGIPGKRVLEKGEIVSIDVGTCYCGYHGDAAITLPCGNIDAHEKD